MTVAAYDQEEEEVFLVWDANGAAFDAFAACRTQWRVAAGPAGLLWLGLDYPAVDVVLRHREHGPEIFEDILAMEAAALEALAETEPK